MTTAAIAAALLVMWHAMPSFAHLFGVYGLLLIVFCLSPLPVFRWLDCPFCLIVLVCSRHWKEVMRITGKELNLAEDVFKLQHLLDCKLLKVRDDMEELTNSAVKEEQIETKLATVGLDWAEQNLVFSDYKTRGPVILKASCAALCMKAAFMHCTHVLRVSAGHLPSMTRSS